MDVCITPGRHFKGVCSLISVLIYSVQIRSNYIYTIN